MMLPKKEQDAFSTETQKGVSKARADASLPEDAGRRNSLDSSPVSSSGSSPSIEVMRCQYLFFFS